MLDPLSATRSRLQIITEELLVIRGALHRSAHPMPLMVLVTIREEIFEENLFEWVLQAGEHHESSRQQRDQIRHQVHHH